MHASSYLDEAKTTLFFLTNKYMELDLPIPQIMHPFTRNHVDITQNSKPLKYYLPIVQCNPNAR